MKKFLLLFVLFAFTSSFAQDIQSYIELLKSDFVTNKKAIIIDVMQFTDKESEVFWPIYNEFEVELEKLTYMRLNNIKDFAANYDDMTDKKADELIKNSFDFAQGQLKLNKKYYKKFAAALTPAVAAKYMQVENAFQLMIDVTIAANVPLFEKPETEQ